MFSTVTCRATTNLAAKRQKENLHLKNDRPEKEKKKKVESLSTRLNLGSKICIYNLEKEFELN